MLTEFGFHHNILELLCIQLLFSGKKITIEVLDKYSVFEYGHEIARIVKSAMLEEQPHGV